MTKAVYRGYMDFDFNARTILLVKHGSQAYGLATPSSDLDVKGVLIEPRRYHYGYLHRFEQHEEQATKDHERDLVIYSLKKFAKLAADCNPSIIEVLWGDDADVLHIDGFGEELRGARQGFLSRKARFTFSGYAHSQLKRIKTHRAWLLDPPKAAPVRSDFGLSDVDQINKSELGAGNAMFESPAEMSKVGIPANVVTLFTKENAYQSAKTHYDQYVNWVKTRNPARSALELRHGYDTKHAMHLVRLMRMCKEILATGNVIVKRSDRDELLGIRNGMMTYDQLIEHAEALEADCEALYETSPLPHAADHVMLDKLVVKLTDRYIRLHG